VLYIERDIKKTGASEPKDSVQLGSKVQSEHKTTRIFVYFKILDYRLRGPRYGRNKYSVSVQRGHSNSVFGTAPLRDWKHS
jgi:hypothetical protein